MTSTKKRIGAVLSNDDDAGQDFARQRQAIRQNAQQLAARHATVTADRTAKVTEMSRILSDGRQTHGASFPRPDFDPGDTQRAKDYARLLGIEMDGSGKRKQSDVRRDANPRDRKTRRTGRDEEFFNPLHTPFDETSFTLRP